MKKNKKTIKRDSNLREKKRVDTVQRVSYRTNSFIRGEGFSQNLSENGCCLFLNEEVPIGSLIEITFDRLGRNDFSVCFKRWRIKTKKENHQTFHGCFL